MSNPLDADWDGSSSVATAGPRTGFVDSFNAAYDQVYKNDSFIGIDSEVQSRWEDTIRRYEARLGKVTGAPVDTATVNEMISPILDPEGKRGWQAGFLGQGEAGEFPLAAAHARENAQRVNQELKNLNDPGLPSIEKILQDVIAARKETDARVAQVTDTSGFAGTLGRFAGGVAGSFTLRDPAQIASLALGGFGRTAAMRVATEIAANAATEAAIVDQTINPTRQLLGEEEQSVMGSALVAGLGAGIIRGTGEGLGILARRALGESPSVEVGQFDLSDEQLASMFRAAEVNPEARAGLSLLHGQQQFEAANPYGGTEAGMKRFTGELEDVLAAVEGKSDTAVARFIEPRNFTVENLDFELQVVRDQQPLLFAQLEAATARLQEIDGAITARSAELDNVTIEMGVRRIDEASADLVADYERTARDTTQPMQVRERAAKQLDIIVKSLGEAQVEKAINDAGIAPKKELQTLRQSRKAAAKQFKAVKDQVDAAIKQNNAAAQVKNLALGKPVVGATRTANVPIKPDGQRYDVVEAQAKAVDEASEAVSKDVPMPTVVGKDTGLQNLGQMGKAMSEGLIDMYVDRAGRGEVKDASGTVSAQLQVIKKLKEAGHTMGREDIEAVVRFVDSITVTGKARQDALNDFIKNYGDIDLGGNMKVPRGFQFMDEAGNTFSAEQLVARLEQDAALVDAMKVCSV